MPSSRSKSTKPGIPRLDTTTTFAPVSDMFRIVHSNAELRPLNTIFPAFRVFLRTEPRRSSCTLDRFGQISSGDCSVRGRHIRLCNESRMLDILEHRLHNRGEGLLEGRNT